MNALFAAVDVGVGVGVGVGAGVGAGVVGRGVAGVDLTGVPLVREPDALGRTDPAAPGPALIPGPEASEPARAVVAGGVDVGADDTGGAALDATDGWLGSAAAAATAASWAAWADTTPNVHAPTMAAPAINDIR